MIKRSEKLAFMQVESGNETVFKRLTGFTEFSISKNPREYSRKYLDEDMERSEVMGYSTSITYKFDADPESEVHQLLYGVADRELIGSEAEVTVVIADLSTIKNGVCNATKRKYSVIPSVEGDDTDTYTVSGTLRAAGKNEFGTAESTDDWQTIIFTEE